MLTCTADAFDDCELTAMALEIIVDLNSKPAIDPHDSFICELAEEIEKEIIDLRVRETISNNPSYTDPSIYLKSQNPSISTIAPSEDHMVYLSYPQSAPQIISRHQLTNSDSFNQCLPPFPSPKKKQESQFKFSSQPKSKQTSKNTRFRSPFHPPPAQTNAVQLNISVARMRAVDECPLSPLSTSAIGSCLSPRDLTPSPQACAIPDFGDYEQEKTVTINVGKKKTKQNTKALKKTHKKKKKQNAFYQIITPINIQKKIQKKRDEAQQRTRSTKNIFATQYTEAQRSNERLHRKRSNSVFLERNETYGTEYAVEVGDELVFIKTERGETRLE